jgi:hypothetical protein
MIINFAQATLKELPNGTIGMSVSTSVNDNNPVNSGVKIATIDTTTFTAPQLQCLNDFIALLNSKL